MNPHFRLQFGRRGWNRTAANRPTYPSRPPKLLGTGVRYDHQPPCSERGPSSAFALAQMRSSYPVRPRLSLCHVSKLAPPPDRQEWTDLCRNQRKGPSVRWGGAIIGSISTQLIEYPATTIHARCLCRQDLRCAEQEKVSRSARSNGR